MKIKFTKYQATGNDFIFINGFETSLHLTQAQIQLLCDRHFGIGSDGLIILRPDEQTDFFMDFYNPDGSIAGFCGNGGRASVIFAAHLGIIDKQTLFRARDGKHRAQITGEDTVKLEMTQVCGIKQHGKEYYLNTGTHHVVIFTENLDQMDIIPTAKEIRYSPRYAPDGTNVNFVEILDKNLIKIRTYEKGVEAETLSCGTGTVASALASAEIKNLSSPIEVLTRGGKLKVYFEQNNGCFKEVFLQGQANKVFTGEIEIF